MTHQTKWVRREATGDTRAEMALSHTWKKPARAAARYVSCLSRFTIEYGSHWKHKLPKYPRRVVHRGVCTLSHHFEGVQRCGWKFEKLFFATLLEATLQCWPDLLMNQLVCWRTCCVWHLAKMKWSIAIIAVMLTCAGRLATGKKKIIVHYQSDRVLFVVMNRWRW